MDAREIDEKLEEAHDRIGGLHADQRKAGRRAAETKVAYEVAHAKAFTAHRAGGHAVEAAKAMAIIDCEAERLAMLLAEEENRSARGAIDVCKTQVDVLRTLAVTHRSVL